MTNIDLSKLQAASEFAGLATAAAPQDSSYPIGTFTLAAGATKQFTLFIPAPIAGNVISQGRVQVVGGSSGLSNYWWPLSGGSLDIIDRNTSGSGTGGFVFSFFTQSGTNGRNLILTITNNTVSGSLTFPGVTVNVHTNFYSYPW